MLKELTYVVTFPSNNQTLKNHLRFEPGVTAISGKNGMGKTFGSIEMVRYGLFGKRALRGPASDYSSLDMSLVFETGGQQYTVKRGKKEQLFDSDGTVLAVGAEAVNTKIPALLGFGLDVFDIACAAKQKESERLSQLRPADRKKLIDEVMGLDSVEKVEKACRTESLGLRREAGALSDQLRVVSFPVAPEDYEKSELLETKMADAQAAQRRYEDLIRVVTGVGTVPTLPHQETISDASVEEYEQKRRDVETERQLLLQELSAIPTTTLTEADILAHEAWKEYQDEVRRRGPQPTLSQDNIEAMLATWQHVEVLQRLGDLEIECSNCSTLLKPGVDPQYVAEPPVLKEKLIEDQARHQRWATPLEAVEDSGLDDATVKLARLALDRGGRRSDIELRLGELPTLVDRSAELAQFRESIHVLAAYEQKLADYNRRKVAADAASQELAGIQNMSVFCVQIVDRIRDARIYEKEQAIADAAQAEFDRLSEVIRAKSKGGEDFKQGADALAKARMEVKAYLAPAISRVASSIISDMSNGDFSAVVVDEDMEITVDGQDIATLSGAGSTVANLALRLALGQVLVARTFPVFFGDEVDADMDYDRSASTVATLAAMKDHLKQIILISHKVIEADQVITFDHAVND